MGEQLELRYLQRLAELFPNIAKASTEIINLQSILNLPKGTEHFITDLHGEYEAFSHVLKNGSGAVKKKIDDVFGHTLGLGEKKSLATLIYYPREKMGAELTACAIKVAMDTPATPRSNTRTIKRSRITFKRQQTIR